MAITKTKAKLIKHNKKLSRFPTLARTFRDSIYKGCCPLPEAFAQELAADAWKYYTDPARVEQKNGLTLEEFPALYEISWKTFNELVEKYECLGTVWNKIRTLIGMVREQGMMHRDFEFQATAWNMGHYSVLWKESKQHGEDFKLKLADKTKPDQKTEIKVYKECFNEDHSSCVHEEKAS